MITAVNRSSPYPDQMVDRCKSRAVKIIKDSNHPGNHLFILLPSGKRFRNMMAKTERLRRSFFPQAMTQFNVYVPGTTMFALSSCTSLFILLLIKSTVYCIAHCISLHILPLIFFSYFYLILTYIYIYSLVLCFIKKKFALSIERTCPDLHFTTDYILYN